MVNTRSISNWTLKLLIKSRKDGKAGYRFVSSLEQVPGRRQKMYPLEQFPNCHTWSIYIPYWFLLEGFFEKHESRLLWNQTSCQLTEAQPYYNATLLCWRRVRYVGYYFIMVLTHMYLDRMGLKLLWDNYYLFGATNVTNNLSGVVKPLLY